MKDITVPHPPFTVLRDVSDRHQKLKGFDPELCDSVNVESLSVDLHSSLSMDDVTGYRYHGVDVLCFSTSSSVRHRGRGIVGNIVPDKDSYLVCSRINIDCFEWLLADGWAATTGSDFRRTWKVLVQDLGDVSFSQFDLDSYCTLVAKCLLLNIDKGPMHVFAFERDEGIYNVYLSSMDLDTKRVDPVQNYMDIFSKSMKILDPFLSGGERFAGYVDLCFLRAASLGLAICDELSVPSDLLWESGSEIDFVESVRCSTNVSDVDLLLLTRVYQFFQWGVMLPTRGIVPQELIWEDAHLFSEAENHFKNSTSYFPREDSFSDVMPKSYSELGFSRNFPEFDQLNMLGDVRDSFSVESDKHFSVDGDLM